MALSLVDNKCYPKCLNGYLEDSVDPRICWKVRDPKLSKEMRDIVLRVGEMRRIRLPEIEIDEFEERVTT
jgi:hypothetical protein